MPTRSDRRKARTRDPAEVFARSFRLAGRLHRADPELSSVLFATGLPQADAALAPRARRDIEDAVAVPRLRHVERRIHVAFSRHGRRGQRL
ncbi:MAG TPA: hypothetical protein VGM75_04025 [Pseudonocardiaceae bacterium]